MAGGAPLGNKNAANGRRFQKAVERVLARKYGDVDKGFEAMAAIYVEIAEGKDPQMLRDIADRSDGKPAQAITDGEGNPLTLVFQLKDERVL